MADLAPGLYLHLPFCSAICPYCDFAVTVGGSDRREAFADALIREIGIVAEDPWTGSSPPARPFDSVYFGGGTPSLLEPEQLAAILRAVDERLDLADDPWIALEANPEDVDDGRLAAWRRLGVSYLSLGVQSFDDCRLRFLGRRHNAAEARRSVERALAGGFPTVSVDLIFGLPGQSVAGWRADLETVAGLAPGHVSCYQLTIEPRTPFATRRRRGLLVEPSEPRLAELFRFTHRLLPDRGYRAYEVSNFASAPEHRSRHNQKYWSHGPYLGLGPGAHSFSGRRRWWNHRRLDDWQAELAAGRRPLAGDEQLAPEQLALEELMLALRQTRGVDLASFRRRHGIDLLAANRTARGRLDDCRLLEIEGGRLRPTLDGLAVADGLAAAFELTPGGAA